MRLGRAGRTTAVAIAAAGLVVALVLLISALGQLTFRSGSPLPRAERVPDVGERVLPEAELPEVPDIVSTVLMVIFSVVLVGGLVMLVFSHDARKDLVRKLAGMALIGAAVFLAARVLRLLRGLGGNIVSSEPVDAVSLDIPNAAAVDPPDWTFPLIAALLSIVVVVTGATLASRLIARWRHRKEEEVPLDGLIEQVGLAADRIRAGGDLRSEVIACYKEMVDILSRQATGFLPVSRLTAREFADHLRDAGMADEHIDRLTGLFELVRYGHRDDERFSDEALACLDAIRASYRPAAEGAAT